MDIKIKDLNTFYSGGFGYLGHEKRTPDTDVILVEAANELGLKTEELALWCDSRLARHAMDTIPHFVNEEGAIVGMIDSVTFKRSCIKWLRKDMPELLREVEKDPYWAVKCFKV
jgi:hypothetical protein